MGLEGQTFSHYRLLRLIGKGGMGEVYLLEDLRVQRQVAGKFIRMDEMQVEQSGASDALRLFWREATAIARLDHPGILPLYDHGEAVLGGSAVAYLIMPYRPEGSLVAWLSKRTRQDRTQQLTLKQIVHFIQQAGESLQYAHDHQVMHLDVKPANFLIQNGSTHDDYPDLLLCDFGIARLATMTSHLSMHVRGTPTYMSPEQCNGHATFASDQYALAVMAYELLTGRPPFQGTPMSVMFAHVQEQPPSVCQRNPLVPAAVDPVLQRGLAKRPDERFPTITAFAQAFQQAFKGMAEATTLRVLHPSPPTPSSSAPISGTPAGDIRATLAISADEAREGAVRVLTLANGRTVNVQIPPGAQSDQVLILIGQGEIQPQSGSAGNLYLTLSVVAAPTPLSQDDGATDLLAHNPQSVPPLFLVPVPKEAPAPITIEMAGSDALTQKKPLSQQATTLPPTQLAPTPIRSSRQLSTGRVGFLLLLILILVIGSSFVLWRVATGNATAITLANHNASATALTSKAPIKTQPFQPSGVSQILFGIVWSGSQFVAVGTSGVILTSSDGHNWTSQNSSTQQVLASIVWSGAQFITVGGSGTILTSSDGHTWIGQGSGTSGDLQNVVWSGSQFVAVGDEDTVLSSPDSHNWAPSYIGGGQYIGDGARTLLGVVWSGLEFVIVLDEGGILTSPDGDIWTGQNSGTSANLWNITKSGSQFVAVGDKGTILTSPDSHIWTTQNSDTNQALKNIAWSGSQFVAVGNHIILTSPDGHTWSAA